jgi:hypothetical protein
MQFPRLLIIDFFSAISDPATFGRRSRPTGCDRVTIRRHATTVDRHDMTHRQDMTHHQDMKDLQDTTHRQDTTLRHDTMVDHQDTTRRPGEQQNAMMILLQGIEKNPAHPILQSLKVN